MASEIPTSENRVPFLRFSNEGSHLLQRNHLLEHPEQASCCTVAKCARASLCLVGLGLCAGGGTLFGFSLVEKLGGGFVALGSFLMSGGYCACSCWADHVDDIDSQDLEELQAFKENCLNHSFQDLYRRGARISKKRISFDQIIQLGLLSREEWREKYCRMLHSVPEKEIVALDKAFEIGIITSGEHQALKDFMAQENPSKAFRRELLEALSISMMPQGGERI